MTLDKGQDSKDSQSQTKAPEGDGTSPAPETFTKAQLDEAVQKAAQKARIQAGRDAKALELRENALKEKESAHEKWQRERDEAEAEKYRDDPDGMKALQAKRELKRQQDELAKQRQDIENEKTANADKLKRADELEIEVNCWKSAQTHGIDATTLKEKCQKFNLTSEEQIEDMAETLAQAKPPANPPIKVDSNKGSGGDGLANLSPSERLKEIERRLKNQ